ncbi:MAG: response regulator [Planctomycetaceae bacterium]|nr:response regulator [Planctomycetaceae bacterium]
MADLNFNLDLELDNDPQLYEMFVENATDLLDQIESDLLILEENGEHLDNAIVNKVFRSAHTIKGDSGFIGLNKIGKLAHAIENVLDALRDEQLTSSPAIIDTLLKSFDKLRDMCSDPMESENTDIEGFVTRLHGIWGPNGEGGEAAPAETTPAEPVAEAAPAPVVPAPAAPAPVPPVAATPAPVASTPKPTETPQASSRRIPPNARILVIDDDPTIGRLVQFWLGKIGICCHCATTAEEALEMMAKQMYFIAICDINMQGCTGIDLIPQLKELNPVVQCIMLTGNANTENIVACIEMGAVDLLSKTNDWTSIIRPVTDALERSARWSTLVNKKIQ